METKKNSLWSTGLALFAMFFGAGNIVFPLALGQYALDKNFYAVLGLILTAVFVPLAGVLAMMLYNGDYGAFFRRIGRVPGFVVTLLILGVIGPFGGIPRCITISHATLSQFGLPLNLPLFSLLSCLVIFLFTYRPNKILSLMGYVLTPALLISLGLIAGIGLFSETFSETTTLTRWQTFLVGFHSGYNTMDLLAAFFFSSVVIACLQGKETDTGEKKPIFKTAILGSLIASFLLGVVYISFSYLAARQGGSLHEVANHEILGTLAYRFLGPYAGLVAGAALAFACLTTEIALAAVIAEFIRKTLAREKIRYETALVITLILSFAISTLRFEGISSFLGPFLEICYPALIVLTLVNILHKLYDFKWGKAVFYSALFASIVVYFC